MGLGKSTLRWGRKISEISSRKFLGEVAERLNAADSKSVLGQLNGGSNPSLSVSVYFFLDKIDLARLGKGLG